MIRLEGLPFLTPLIMLAEAAGSAFALNQIKNSEMQWRHTLKGFVIFEARSDLLRSPWDLPNVQFYRIFVSPIALAVTSPLAIRQIVLTPAKRLRCAYAGGLFSYGLVSQADAATAWLIGLVPLADPKVFLFTILVCACIVSFLVSQCKDLIGNLNIHGQIRVVS